MDIKKVEAIRKELFDFCTRLELSEILKEIATKVKSYLNCEECSIFIFDRQKQLLFFEIVTGPKFELLKKITIPLGEGIVGRCALDAYDLIVNDCLDDPRFKSDIDRRTGFVTRSIAAVRVKVKSELIGVIEAINKLENDFNEDDLQLLQEIAKIIAIPLQNALLVRELLEKERLQKELQIAREIQQSFLSTKSLKTGYFEAEVEQIFSSFVGGDYYELLKLDEDNFLLTLNDISGHGIPASLLMTIFRSNFIYQIKRNQNLQQVYQFLNDFFAEITEPQYFLTSFCSIFNQKEKKLTFLNAAHPPALLFRDGKVIRLEANNSIVGAFANIDFKVSSLQMRAGDVLFIYSDGVIEVEDEEGEQFSLARVENILKASINYNAREISDLFLKAISSFHPQPFFADDITFIVFKVIK